MLNIFDLTDQDCPLEVFQSWYEEAKQSEKLPDGFSLATSGSNGRVSNRYLNYKGVRKIEELHHLMFVGGFESQKAKQIQEHDRVAMNFFWQSTGKQVRIEGAAKPMPSDVSDELFLARGELSRLASMVSSQSQEIKNYDELKDRFFKAKELIEGDKTSDPHFLDITKRPSSWGAFGIIPNYYEFFVYGDHRLNVRLEYTQDQAGAWKTRWLNP